MHTDPGSFKKTNRLNYYMLKSSLYFRFGMGDKVRELENEFQRRISSKQDAKNMQILCAVNNLKRARATRTMNPPGGFIRSGSICLTKAARICGPRWEEPGSRRCWSRTAEMKPLPGQPLPLWKNMGTGFSL